MNKDEKAIVSPLLLDDYRILSQYTKGQSIKAILEYRDDCISILLEDGMKLTFTAVENDLFCDIEFFRQNK